MQASEPLLAALAASCHVLSGGGLTSCSQHSAHSCYSCHPYRCRTCFAPPDSAFPQRSCMGGMPSELLWWAMGVSRLSDAQRASTQIESPGPVRPRSRRGGHASHAALRHHHHRQCVLRAGSLHADSMPASCWLHAGFMASQLPGFYASTLLPTPSGPHVSFSSRAWAPVQNTHA